MARVTRADGSSYESLIIMFTQKEGLRTTVGFKYATIGKTGRGAGCFDWDKCPYRPKSPQGGNTIVPVGDWIPLPPSWITESL